MYIPISDIIAIPFERMALYVKNGYTAEKALLIVCKEIKSFAWGGEVRENLQEFLSQPINEEK